MLTNSIPGFEDAEAITAEVTVCTNMSL